MDIGRRAMACFVGKLFGFRDGKPYVCMFQIVIIGLGRAYWINRRNRNISFFFHRQISLVTVHQTAWSSDETQFLILGISVWISSDCHWDGKILPYRVKHLLRLEILLKLFWGAVWNIFTEAVSGGCCIDWLVLPCISRA